MRRLLLFFICLSCFGAARVASVTGNWSSTATWGGSSVPGNGDTVTINSGITLTVDANETIGTSPADCTGTQAIQNNSGILTIAAGVQLTLRGCVTLVGSGKLNEGANSILEFDSSAASSPSTTHYQVSIGTTCCSETTLFTATGTDFNNMAVIRSNTGGGNGYLRDAGGQPGGMVNFNYVSLSRIGDSSNNAVTFWPFNSTDVFTWNHVLCDNCGTLLHHVLGDVGATVSITNSTWTNSLSTSIQLLGSASIGAGTHVFSGNVVDGVLNVGLTEGWEYSNSYLAGGWSISGGPWAKFDDMLINVIADNVMYGDVTNTFMFGKVAKANPHYLIHTNTYDVLVDNVIWQELGSATDGDTIQVTGTTPNLVTVQNSIKLPNGSGTSSGTAFTCGCSTSSQIAINKNTYFLGGARESSGIRYGETITPGPGMFTSIKSNVFWDTSAQGWKFLCISPPCNGGADSNVVAGANADYNAGSSTEYLAGLAGKGYDSTFTVAPGAHDLDLDPGFADSSRGLLAYDLHCGGAGTETSVLAGFQARNSASWNACYDIAKLINWVRQGFAPQRVEYATGGSDGARIGAVQPVAIMGAAVAQ